MAELAPAMSAGHIMCLIPLKQGGGRARAAGAAGAQLQRGRPAGGAAAGAAAARDAGAAGRGARSHAGVPHAPPQVGVPKGCAPASPHSRVFCSCPRPADCSLDAQWVSPSISITEVTGSNTYQSGLLPVAGSARHLERRCVRRGRPGQRCRQHWAARQRRCRPPQTPRTADGSSCWLHGQPHALPQRMFDQRRYCRTAISARQAPPPLCRRMT